MTVKKANDNLIEFHVSVKENSRKLLGRGLCLLCDICDIVMAHYCVVVLLFFFVDQ